MLSVAARAQENRGDSHGITGDFESGSSPVGHLAVQGQIGAGPTIFIGVRCSVLRVAADDRCADICFDTSRGMA